MCCFCLIRYLKKEKECNKFFQYKMFVEGGEYVYSLERENELSEFYMTDIQFIETT